MNKQQFDWDYYKSRHNSRRVQWLLEKCDQPITEEQFVLEHKLLRSFSESKGKTRRNSYSNHNLKYQFRKLKEKFGFFPSLSTPELLD
jgi:hypothetical protein